MRKIIFISILVLVLFTTLVFVYWWQRGDAILVQPTNNGIKY